MKKFLLILSLAFSGFVMADSCDVTSMLESSLGNGSLKPLMEKILISKGYTVYETSEYYLDRLGSNVSEGTYLAVSNGIASYSQSTMCQVAGKTVFCDFDFDLYKVTEKGHAIVAKISGHPREKIRLFRSAQKIADAFYNDIVKQAQAIPSCPKN